MTAPPVPDRAWRPDFAFVDVEASSLSDGYPVEVGWSDDGLAPASFLVRPDPSWTLSDWSLASQAVHGLSRERLMDEGVDVREAAERLRVLGDATLVMSDEPELDGGWLARLFRAAGVPMPFEVNDYSLALPCHVRLDASNRDAYVRRFAVAHAVVERAFPHPHRAGPDAVRLAATFRVAVDDDFRKRVQAWKDERGLDGFPQPALPF